MNTKMGISSELISKIMNFEKNEITEHLIYRKLSLLAKEKNNKKVLERIAYDELSHYNFWKKFTSEDLKPNKFKVFFYYYISKFFGLNFGLRLMERGEDIAQTVYQKLIKLDPKVKKIIEDEETHEKKILSLLDKKELLYTGSIVLGLNDALVELTGALAGFTLALQQTKIIAIAGAITGIAASLSMACSEYLSTKEEGTKNPLKASVYTGIAYSLVVLLLILPYFILKNPLACLGVTLAFALLIIFIFNFYISVAKNLSFKKRFFEMVTISLGVAALSFFIGLLVRKYLNIQI